MISVIKADGKREFEFLKSIREKTLAPGANVDDVVKNILADVKQNGGSEGLFPNMVKSLMEQMRLKNMKTNIFKKRLLHSMISLRKYS